MKKVRIVLPVVPQERRLTAAQFQDLAEIPPEAEWFANLNNAQTRRAYQADLKHFMAFIGIQRAEEFRQVTRSHVIAWRHELERHSLAPSSIRRKLAALASLFAHLCESNAVSHNPVDGVKRPPVETYQGKTPVIGDDEAAALLDQPDSGTLKGLRDRAILSVMLYQGLRREEVARLRVKDLRLNAGFLQLEVRGKGGKTRYLPVNVHTAVAVNAYLVEAGHLTDGDGAMFRALRNPAGGSPRAGLTGDGVYRIVRGYLGGDDSPGGRLGPHVLRATAATNALENNADISKVQEWLGHANIATTRIYDRRRMRPEDSPSFKVRY